MRVADVPREELSADPPRQQLPVSLPQDSVLSFSTASCAVLMLSPQDVTRVRTSREMQFIDAGVVSIQCAPPPELYITCTVRHNNTVPLPASLSHVLRAC